MVVEQPRTLLDEIGGREVTRRAAQHAITAMLADNDPELSVRPLFVRVLAEGGVDAHVGHLARSFEQLFRGGSVAVHSPRTPQVVAPYLAGRCTGGNWMRCPRT